jgi:chemotaxis protein CheC
MTLPTARQEDALRELAHLGSAQAASMLARLVGDVGVLVDVPQVLNANRWQLGWLLGGRDVPVFAAAFEIHGELSGRLWWVLTSNDARRLGQRLMRRPGVRGLLSEDLRAALTEAANIVASSTLSSIGTMVHANLLPSTPEVTEVPVSTLVGPPGESAVVTVLAASFVSTNAPTFGGWLVMFLEDVARDDVLHRLGL